MARRRSSAAALVACAALSCASAVEAQLVPRVPVLPEAGEEVRVIRVGERGAIYGPFVEADPEQVVLEASTGLLRIPRSSISGMSVQRGYESKALVGSLFGAGVGMLAGALLGNAGGGGSVTTLSGAALGIGAGWGAGFLIGWSQRTPIWHGVDMDDLRPNP